MAALLESLLLGKLGTSKALVWLKYKQSSKDQPSCEPLLQVQRQEFVSFLLNFLRDQSSHTLTHGPATPAKTPVSSRSAARSTRLSSDRGCRGGRSAGGGTGSRGNSRVQLFSPAPSVSPLGGSQWEGSAAAASTSSRGELSGVSGVSSPSFSSVWSPAPRPLQADRRSAHRSSLGDFMTSSPPEMHPHSPAMATGQQQQQQQHHRGSGRRRCGGSGGGGRPTGGRGFQQDDPSASWERGARRGRGGRAGEAVSPPTQVALNFNNLEDFPPVGASQHASPVLTKPSRRINPTPVHSERPNSKPKSCFTSTPLSQPCSPPTIPEGALVVGSPLGLQEEREMLRKEKSKLQQQTCSPLKPTTEPCTPTKPVRMDPTAAQDPTAPTPDPSKVTLTSELDLLAELYCTCISENLVPNVFLELFFVLQLLTCRSPPALEGERDGLCGSAHDLLERGYFRDVHNCVYFAVKVVENQFELVCHLDKCTVRLLAENERVGSFAPALRDRLALAQDTSTAKVSPSLPSFIHSVPFQPATDNRSNFNSDRAFHIFKKQRDIFYELLRDWEDFHKEPGWEFETALGNRIRAMVSLQTAAGNHAHFARLFQKQLVQMCKEPGARGSFGEAPDADVLSILGADGLSRLKRLQERLIQPQGFMGPCPPPSFPGHQEFFRDFLQSASCCQLNQHLKDGMCQELLLLDEVSILGAPAGGSGEEEEGDGDMDQQDEKQRFSSVLLVARLLAKFLGFISFLPYHTSDPPSKEIQEAAIALRSKSSPVLDVCAVLRSCVRRHRLVLTLPWLVEFLSMMDYTGPYLPCFRAALGSLLHLYRRMLLGRGAEVCYLNQLLLVAVLGWLFQIPVFPEDVAFSEELDFGEETLDSSQGLDSLPLVDQQLLYTCCPFLGELRKLLAAFVAGSTAKSGGLLRKITPTSAEPRDPPTTRSQQKLQMELEQAFFHNQPPSLKRTVEFVAERVSSNCVKHIKATLVSELVKGGERALREALAVESANVAKLNDTICTQLCYKGMQALETATRFCSEKGPEAVRVLLPEETSPAVLSTSESITTRLATEKACTWLSSNITALIKREWKSVFDRVMKTLPSPPPPNPEAPTQTQTQIQTQTQAPTDPQRGGGGQTLGEKDCPPECTHQAPRASSVITDIKEVLSIAVGPRAEDEGCTIQQLQALLDRARETLQCRKFLSVVPEQMLVRCTIMLACRLVSGELPLAPPMDSAGIRGVLQQLVHLWGSSPLPSLPLHLLFASPTLTAVLRLTDTDNCQNFRVLVHLLLEAGLLGKEDVVSHWRSLLDLSWTMESIEKIQELSISSVPSASVSLPSHRDLLQISQ
ncbi:codanin-1 [Clupea harengus]|uniref:Codanin-1 n=1 Tax=Clupea harengus TaxID=7950 RepID=A0A6P8GLM6_CLUHA|nr:codanin-1 [Clupea harengus]